MPDEVVDIVDFRDNKIGDGLKSRCHREGLWHRSASIFVFNDDGDVLIQKRAKRKSRHPSKLCESASGHIAKDESYEAGAKREMKEEIGIEADLKFIANLEYEENHESGDIDKEHVKIYSCTHNGPFKIDKHEVSSVQFISLKKIQDMLNKDKEQFVPSFRASFQAYLDSINF